jgi:alanine racemase
MQDFSSAGSILEIDMAALAANYRLFQKKTGQDTSVAGVVKADAYGLGLKPVVEKLTDLGCPQFFVATLDEAITLRQFNQKTPVAVLGGLFKGAEEEYLTHDILPVINSPDDLNRWQKLANKTGTALPTILHFDTGMNRLGFSKKETYDLLEQSDKFKKLNVQLIMSHFVNADEKDDPITQKQADDFAVIAQYFPNVQKSLANSPGLFRSESYHYNLVRPGFALYGGNPTPETNNPMNRVVSLSTRILQLRECKSGDSIGYGSSYTFKENTKTATVALGYADGFLRSASNKATLYWRGQPCPVIGRVSMDLVTIDLSNLKQEQPETGDTVEILGPNQSVDDLATAAGTIGYEILTSLGARHKRVYS